ncbi:malonic semialdehyde reductase [Fodinicurvata fenggangensis]|uniref:malonic semialdehyde reductase n=1 Tax=Fodinicurvata fenggangensis TaxID=1121830 RepID=UPI000A8BAE7E
MEENMDAADAPESKSLDQEALDQIFLQARTHNAWQDRPVPDSLLQRLWKTACMGPTSANCLPMRLVFVKSVEAKEQLRPHLAKGNEDKTMKAPVTAIIGYDTEFHEQLPRLFPHADARSWFAGDSKQQAREENAFRNGSLQGAYLIIAARALGLDCGPMSGFNKEGVDKTFFAGTTVRSNFLCNLGYGDPSVLHDRLPRLEFDEACRIA